MCLSINTLLSDNGGEQDVGPGEGEVGRQMIDSRVVVPKSFSFQGEVSEGMSG